MKALAKWNADPRVQEAFVDSDGYWVYLNDGFCSDTATHIIHEMTVKDVDRCMKDIDPCDCRDCTSR